MGTATAPKAQQNLQVLEVVREVEIAASIDIVFETVLEQLGPMLSCGEDAPLLDMKLEAWPGGRWFRDLGNGAGHLWGHVQAIRPPELLELHGPMFMSAAATSHVQFRLQEVDGLTRLDFSHRAMGLIPLELQDGVDVNQGWTNYFAKLRGCVDKRLKP
ncbi:SRPBCC domain-containing protein [Alloacidobacterium dinghuense]|uniref:SRPBCC domain-containing protein n=1 Tax=Alloacidobacterium dinghuense TaxID=2763107 RepID=A0A7G8BKB0_9BACT|nr:SRPBCC domain-containing protein [Alloacidobacterium dinghuense]QNI32980.1 SRPBCC domain-containing protein [Alloacidobacterium dinghuense]